MRTEVRGRGVDDEMQAFQRCSCGLRGSSQLGEVLVAAPVEDLGDEVLLAVKELVDRRCRVPRQVGDSAERAGPQPVFAEDQFGGVEDLASVLRAAGSAALAAQLGASRIRHKATITTSA